ncbi:MAG: hypothetical protein QOF51_3474 [Chloroflexota bacterium]|nr:hypothetical protein [Chloroflexota bacterium]
MKYVEIGGLQVSALGLGCWQMGASEWGYGRDFGPNEVRRIVHRALDLGITLFDTAEIYGQGRSEVLLGGALRGRQDVIVASKVWPLHFTTAGVVAAAQRSLQRLGRDHVDLYQLHWPNPFIPLTSTMRGMQQVLEAGMAWHVGVSNFGRERWQRAEALLGVPVITDQVSYSLLQRQPERELLPYAVEARRGIIAYSPLAQGVLGGGYGPEYQVQGARRTNPLFFPANLRRAQPLIAALRVIATAHDATPAQIALAWAIAHPGVVAIPGARRVEQVEANAAAADIELTAEEMARLDEVSQAARPVGLLRAASSLNETIRAM